MLVSIVLLKEGLKAQTCKIANTTSQTQTAYHLSTTSSGIPFFSEVGQEYQCCKEQYGFSLHHLHPSVINLR